MRISLEEIDSASAASPGSHRRWPTGRVTGETRSALHKHAEQRVYNRIEFAARNFAWDMAGSRDARMHRGFRTGLFVQRSPIFRDTLPRPLQALSNRSFAATARGSRQRLDLRAGCITCSNVIRSSALSTPSNCVNNSSGFAASPRRDSPRVIVHSLQTRYPLEPRIKLAPPRTRGGCALTESAPAARVERSGFGFGPIRRSSHLSISADGSIQ